ncbi:MAG: HDOD domain-containing protein [Halothiobacillus sp.]
MPLPNDWIAHLQNTPLPVRGEVHRRLSDLLRHDEIDLGEIVGWLRRDPAACGFVMGAAARAQRSKNRNAPHSLDHALSLLGITWIKQTLPKLPIIEDVFPDLAHRNGYLIALARSLHAARHAESWLVELHDTSYEIVVVATLLHNFIELALWRDAPELMRTALIQVRDGQTSTLGHAIKTVLADVGIDLKTLEQALNGFYYLPTQLFADEAATPILARQHQIIVLLARRLSFFSEIGWYHPEIIATQKEIAELLKRDCAATDQLIHQVAVKTAHEFEPIGLYSSAKLLIDSAIIPVYWPFPAEYGIGSPPIQHAQLNLAARITAQKNRTPNTLIKSLLASLIEDLGLVRVLILSRTPDANFLTLNMNKRPNPENYAHSLNLSHNPLLERLMAGNKALTIQANNRNTLNRLLDTDGQKLVAVDCYLQTLNFSGQPFALVVIDIQSERDLLHIRALFDYFMPFWPR